MLDDFVDEKMSKLGVFMIYYFTGLTDDFPCMTEQSGSAGQASTRGDISNEIEILPW
jgi:hypothetical protein